MAMDAKWRYAGVTIVLGSSLGAAAGLLAGQIASTLAIGIAMVGILIGSALARGAFAERPASPAKLRPTTNHQPSVLGKE